jgi:hypothetical protein
MILTHLLVFFLSTSTGFPVVETTATTDGTTASTSAVVNLPASIASGDLLVMLHRAAGAGALSWPAGWTQLAQSTADGSDDVTGVAYRAASGSEGATATVTQGNVKFANLCYRISNAANPATQPPEINTAVTSASDIPNPGSLTPTGGAKDYLWLWMGGITGSGTWPPSAGDPANYTDPIQANTGSADTNPDNCEVFSVRRVLNAVSEDPPLWDLNSSDFWTAWTVAVHPPGGAVASKITLFMALDRRRRV